MQDEVKRSQANARVMKFRMQETKAIAKKDVKKRLEFDTKPRKVSLLLSKTTLSKTDSKDEPFVTAGEGFTCVAKLVALR